MSFWLALRPEPAAEAYSALPRPPAELGEKGRGATGGDEGRGGEKGEVTKR